MSRNEIPLHLRTSRVDMFHFKPMKRHPGKESHTFPDAIMARNCLHALWTITALNGCFISISTRGSDCSHNLSMSIRREHFLYVCQLPTVHFHWQNCSQSIFTGNVSAPSCYDFCPSSLKTFWMVTKPLTWRGWSVYVCRVCRRTINMIHKRALIKSVLRHAWWGGWGFRPARLKRTATLAVLLLLTY